MRLVLFLLATLSTSTPLFAFEIAVLRDINTDPASDSGTTGSRFIEFGGKTVFAGTTARHGREPWISAGTEAGTSLLKDIFPGEGLLYPGEFTEFNGELYFTATDGLHGDEVWKTDGTPDGTVMLRDINPSTKSHTAFPPDHYTVFEGALYFQQTDGLHGNELWVSDGTPEGTSLVVDLNPGPAHGFPHGLTVVGSTLLFFADDGVRGTELWKSDGTAAGTSLVKEISPNPFNPAGVASKAVWDGILYFLCDDGIFGQELWRSDGSEAGTRMVKNIHPTAGSRIRDLTVVGDRLFFFAFTDTHGFELWSSDGTQLGTAMVKDIAPGSESSYTGRIPGPVIVDLEGTALLVAVDGRGAELWRSDGTEAGTVIVKDILPGEGDAMPSWLVVHEGTAYFAARSDANGNELWKSDGTAAGTSEVKDLNPAGDGSPRGIRIANGSLYFTADNPLAELWVSDGTGEGTRMLADPDIRSGGSQPHRFTVVNDQLYFYARTEAAGRELWITDGTEGETRLVADIRPGPDSGDPSDLTAAGNYLYFISDAPDGLRDRLWRSDGSEVGTIMLLDAVPSRLTALGSLLLFRANDGVSGEELWKSDGTIAGTARVKDIRTGALGSAPDELAVMGDTLFFSAQRSSDEGIELWKSDGTAEGTVLVRDIDPTTSSSSDPEDLTPVNGTLFFHAERFAGNRELWKSDGTEAGTVLVKEIVAGDVGSWPRALFAAGETLYFTANDEVHGLELWKSDGTAPGTVLVKDIGPGPQGSNPRLHAEVGGAVLFAAANFENGYELWRTDGTEAGTVLVKDIYPGPRHGLDLQFTAVHDGLLYFRGEDVLHGYEIWVSDGTPRGTIPLDFWPGPESSWPVAYTVFQDKVYFAADDFEIGREPFTIRLTEDLDYLAWAASQGLSGHLAQPEFVLFDDELPHLLKYAFNLDATGPDFRTLVPGTGTAGLPTFSGDLAGENVTLHVEYLRRTNSNLNYTPQVSANGRTWEAIQGSETVTAIDAEWERVVLTQAFDWATVPVQFARVKVVLSPVD